MDWTNFAFLMLGACLGVAGLAGVVGWSRRDDFEDGYRTGFIDATDRAPLDMLPEQPADPREPWRH